MTNKITRCDIMAMKITRGSSEYSAVKQRGIVYALSRLNYLTFYEPAEIETEIFASKRDNGRTLIAAYWELEAANQPGLVVQIEAIVSPEQLDWLKDEITRQVRMVPRKPPEMELDERETYLVTTILNTAGMFLGRDTDTHLIQRVRETLGKGGTIKCTKK